MVFWIYFIKCFRCEGLGYYVTVVFFLRMSIFFYLLNFFMLNEVEVECWKFDFILLFICFIIFMAFNFRNLLVVNVIFDICLEFLFCCEG